MKFFFKSLVFSIFACLIFQSCTKDKAQFSPTPYNHEIPSHFPAMDIPTDNPMTEQGVNLGRKLFYEKLLSGNNTMSCASCHNQAFSFSDTSRYSVGIDGILGDRQAMALTNIGYEEYFFGMDVLNRWKNKF